MKLSIHGTITSAAFIINAVSAQYGMEIMDGSLYAISTPGIKGYDLETGEEVVNIAIDDVTFPNGMASNGSNFIWITDTFGPSIVQIDVQDRQNQCPGTNTNRKKVLINVCLSGYYKKKLT